MIEHGIICKADEVRAWLRGKTQIRRAVKQTICDKSQYDLEPGDVFWDIDGLRRAKESRGRNKSASGELTYEMVKSPFGVPGDVIWVKEKWRPLICMFTNELVGACFRWRGGGRTFNDKHRGSDGIDDTWPFRSSTQMPRWAATIVREIVSVRVERLWDISQVDIWKEGTVVPWPEPGTMRDGAMKIMREAMQRLWNARNKPEDAWEHNCWVFVAEVKEMTGD